MMRPVTQGVFLSGLSWALCSRKCSRNHINPSYGPLMHATDDLTEPLSCTHSMWWGYPTMQHYYKCSRNHINPSYGPLMHVTDDLTEPLSCTACDGAIPQCSSTISVWIGVAKQASVLSSIHTSLQQNCVTHIDHFLPQLNIKKTEAWSF